MCSHKMKVNIRRGMPDRWRRTLRRGNLMSECSDERVPRLQFLKGVRQTMRKYIVGVVMAAFLAISLVPAFAAAEKAKPAPKKAPAKKMAAPAKAPAMPAGMK